MKIIRLDRTPEHASIEGGGAESRPCFSAPMAATIWSTLPEDHLHQIFARLPPPEIIRLQCLSPEWKSNLTSRDSAFKRVCAKASKSKMFAMVSEVSAHEDSGHLDSVSVKLFDIKANRWHSCVHHLGSHFYHVNKLYPGDGGLMCVISTDTLKGETPLITVLNPLDPGRRRVLPHHGLRDLELQMVQLVMDRDRRCSKVLAVGKKNGGVVAKIFSSETGAWDGEIFENLIFGHQIVWSGGDVQDDSVGPCAYDCAGHRLLELIDGSLPLHDRCYVYTADGELSSLCYALVEDHLFVLHVETYDDTDIKGNTSEFERHCISEYRGQMCRIGLFIRRYWHNLDTIF